MNELTPVLRADHTGKMVTRHMKLSKPSASRSAIAPPTVAKVDSLSELRQNLIEALQMGVNDSHADLDREQMDSLLTLAQSHQMSVAGPELMDGMAPLRGKAFGQCIGLLDRNFDLADSVMSSLEYRAMHYQAQVPLLVTGLNLHSFEMSPADEQVLTDAVCRIWVSDALDDHKYVDKVFPMRQRGTEPRSIGTTALREDLAQYIVQNHDRAPFIVKMITERKISDPKEIESMLKSASTTALIDGVL